MEYKNIKYFHMFAGIQITKYNCLKTITLKTIKTINMEISRQYGQHMPILANIIHIHDIIIHIEYSQYLANVCKVGHIIWRQLYTNRTFTQRYKR